MGCCYVAMATVVVQGNREPLVGLTESLNTARPADPPQEGIPGRDWTGEGVVWIPYVHCLG